MRSRNVFALNAWVMAAVTVLGAAGARAEIPQTSVRTAAGRHVILDKLAPQGDVLAWNSMATLPVATVRYASCQCPGNYNNFWVISGVTTGGTIITNNQRYDATANSWTTLAPIPVGSEGATAVCDGTYIYVLGGNGSTTFYRYDIAGNTWSTLATMPRAGYGQAMGLWNNTIYFIGGGATPSSTVNIYSITSNTWTGTGPAAPGAILLGSWAQAERYVYVIGSYGTTATTNSTVSQRYDMSTDTWSTGPVWTPGRADGGLAIAGGLLYQLAGDAQGGTYFNPTSNIETLDYTTWPAGTWTSLADPLPALRQAATCGACTYNVPNAGIWLSGGHSGAFNNTNYLRPSSGICFGACALTVTPTTLPNGTPGVPYSQTITATGGAPPYTFAVTAGTLPTGLSLNATTGVLDGTPTASGTFNFTITATDSGGSCNGSQAYTVSMGCGTITFSPASLPGGTVGIAYGATVTASGGTAPYTYAVTAGTLTPGLSLDTNTGAITGTPTAAGTSTFTITATDASACTGSQAYSIVIVPAPGNCTFAVPELMYYRFDQAGSGTVTNQASAPVGTNPAPLLGGLTQGGVGQFNTALVGSGVSATTDYVNTGWATSLGTGNWTISLWINNIPPSATLYYIFGDSTAGSFRCFTNGVAGPNNFMLRGTGIIDTTVTGVLPGPTVLTFVRNGSEIRGYRNGVLNVTTTGHTANIVGAGPFKVCGYAANIGMPAGGLMDEFRMYNRALSAAEVAATWNQGLPINKTVTIAPATLPGGSAGVPYSQTLTASGGAAPYTYVVTSGSLPTGLALDLNTGVISGTPTAGGTYNFSVTAVDATGCTGVQAYSIVIACPTITLSPATLPNGTQGIAYSQTISASGGTAPYTFAVTSGTLPAGLALNATTGEISGTPTGSGTSNFDVTATDAGGCTGVQAYSITIAGCTITLSPATLPNGTQGVAYSQTVTASGGTAPYTYAVTTGTLPAGLTLNGASGVISGTPTASGTSNFTITATDANTCSGSQAYSITISCPAITLAPATLPNGAEGLAYSQTLSASGGTPPYSYTVTSGSLPAGLALNSSSGVLSGTPTTAGTSTFAVTATDSGGCTNLMVLAQTYTMTITPAVDFIVGEGLGNTGGANTNRVRVYKRDNLATTVDFQAYAAGNWGTNVASANVNGASYWEILTGPGPGDVYGPQVKAFDRLGNPIPKVNFYAYGTLKYGVNVAGGDLDNDGFGEILSGAGPGAVFGPHVRGFNFDNVTLTSIAKISFFAYGTLKWGVNVEEGNVDGDNWTEILTGPGPGNVFPTNVRGFNYDNATVAQMGKINFIAHPPLVFGVNVAGGDVDNDGFAEIATTPGPTAGNATQFLGWQFDNATITQATGFSTTPWTSTTYGGRVGLGDINSDGRWDLLAGRGRDPLADSEARRYDYNGTALTQTGTILPFAQAGYGYGVNVAGGGLGHY